MDMLTCIDTCFCIVKQIADSSLDQYRLKTRNIEQLLLCHPSQSSKGLNIFALLTQLRIGFDDSYHFIVRRHPVHGQFTGVCVSDTDLADFDLGLNAAKICQSFFAFRVRQRTSDTGTNPSQRIASSDVFHCFSLGDHAIIFGGVQREVSYFSF